MAIDRLERLRKIFLGEAAGRAHDYWDSRETLTAYDEFWGRKIGWKWRAALEELAYRGWTPPKGRVVDWGCGSGIASRAWAAAHADRLDDWTFRFEDRSALAVAFAADSLRRDQPSVAVANDDTPADVVLLSHVINELDDLGLDRLVARLATTRAFVWVEPGARIESRRLGDVRRRFLAMGDWALRGPCTHERSCGYLDAGRERDWCHSFAKPPSDASQDGDWVKTARRLGIDLRSAPYAYLAMERGGAPMASSETRVVGTPRIYKGFAKIEACNGAEGVREITVQKRDDAALWKRLRNLDEGAPFFNFD